MRPGFIAYAPREMAHVESVLIDFGYGTCSYTFRDECSHNVFEMMGASLNGCVPYLTFEPTRFHLSTILRRKLESSKMDSTSSSATTLEIPLESLTETSDGVEDESCREHVPVLGIIHLWLCLAFTRT